MGVHQHIVVIVIIGISLYRTLVPGNAQSGMNPKKECLSVQFLLMNAALAVGLLLISGLTPRLPMDLQVKTGALRHYSAFHPRKNQKEKK